MRFGFIHAEKVNHTVSGLCRNMEVTRQGYYAWVRRRTSKRSTANAELAAEVSRLHAASWGTYGSPRIHRALVASGRAVGKRRVERTMRELGICGKRRSRYRVTTSRDPSKRASRNVLDRDFSASRPDEKWVTDITYIRTHQGWSYLAAIIDLYSRRVVGWSVGESMAVDLPLRALSMAQKHREPGAGLLHHSDRGTQYTSASYRRRLAQAGMTPSMSRKGNCWDNAVAESFFATLKVELIRDRTFRNQAELRAALFEYIEIFYNRQRMHSSNGYVSPEKAEQNYHAAKAA